MAGDSVLQRRYNGRVPDRPPGVPDRAWAMFADHVGRWRPLAVIATEHGVSREAVRQAALRADRRVRRAQEDTGLRALGLSGWLVDRLRRQAEIAGDPRYADPGWLAARSRDELLAIRGLGAESVDTLMAALEETGGGHAPTGGGASADPAV